MKTCGVASCDQEATVVKLEISLCDEHEYDFYIKMKSFFFDRRMQEFMDKGYIARHSPGSTYIVTLGNGNVKIGYSSNLEKRFKELDRELGPLRVLAVMDGGETREAFLHYKFNHLRVSNLRLEQFHPEPELINYAHYQGISRLGLQALNKIPKDSSPKHKIGAPSKMDRPFIPPKKKDPPDPELLTEVQRLLGRST